MIDIIMYSIQIGTFGGGTKIQDKIRKVTTLDKKWIRKGHNTLSWTSLVSLFFQLCIFFQNFSSTTNLVPLTFLHLVLGSPSPKGLPPKF